MDPIRPSFTPNITPPAETPAGKQVSDAARTFDVSSAARTTPTPPASQPVFSQMASCIQDGVNRSLTRDQVRDELIDREVKTTFGGRATPGMTAAIGEAFKNDPHLSQLFNELYTRATTTK